MKQHLYNRTFGIAHIRGFASRAPIFQMMQSLAIKRTIWRYLDVAKLVELEVGIATLPTNEYGTYTVINMLAGKHLWLTKGMSSLQVESVVLGVAAGSRVTSFDVASLCRSEFRTSKIFYDNLPAYAPIVLLPQRSVKCSRWPW